MSSEQRAIAVAHAYAMANGYEPDDKTAAGLFLVGMVIGAVLSGDAQTEVVAEYLHQHPHTAEVIMAWARQISGETT